LTASISLYTTRQHLSYNTHYLTPPPCRCFVRSCCWQVRPRPARILVYDQRPGGVGACDAVFAARFPLLRAALALLRDCACKRGCPACIQSFGCSNYNALLDKAGAMVILEGIVEAMDVSGVGGGGAAGAGDTSNVGASGATAAAAKASVASGSGSDDASSATDSHSPQQPLRGSSGDCVRLERQRRHNMAVARGMTTARTNDLVVRSKWASCLHDDEPEG
jgi:Domain of unknown function (DUF1998)